jgi:hypothetical protein
MEVLNFEYAMICSRSSLMKETGKMEAFVCRNEVLWLGLTAFVKVLGMKGEKYKWLVGELKGMLRYKTISVYEKAFIEFTVENLNSHILNIKV